MLRTGTCGLLWHRHRLVQMRTRVMNQLHVVALHEGVRRKKALWRPARRAEAGAWGGSGLRNHDCLDIVGQERYSQR